MTTPRIAFGAALLASALSLDPRVDARSAVNDGPSPPAAPAEAPLEADIESPAPIGPLPADMRAEITPEPRGFRVALRRPGHLVALQYGPARAGGVDRAHVTIAAEAKAEGRIRWEATKLGTLETERGFLSLRIDGSAIHTEGFVTAPPAPMAASQSALHACTAHRDDAGGFSALCLLAGEARRVSAANVTGHEALQDVWIAPGKRALIRLDFPLAPGAAEAKIITFVHGLRLSVLRVEAIRPDGEAPTMTFYRAEREQPTSDWR